MFLEQWQQRSLWLRCACYLIQLRSYFVNFQLDVYEKQVRSLQSDVDVLNLTTG